MNRYYTDGRIRHEGSALSALSWMLVGVAVGAGLMYMLDPNQGNRRRALARDKARSAANKARKRIDATSRDLSNRAQGIKHQASALLSKANGRQYGADDSGAYGSMGSEPGSRGMSTGGSGAGSMGSGGTGSGSNMGSGGHGSSGNMGSGSQGSGGMGRSGPGGTGSGASGGGTRSGGLMGESGSGLDNKGSGIGGGNI